MVLVAERDRLLDHDPRAGDVGRLLHFVPNPTEPDDEDHDADQHGAGDRVGSGSEYLGHDQSVRPVSVRHAGRSWRRGASVCAAYDGFAAAVETGNPPTWPRFHPHPRPQPASAPDSLRSRPPRTNWSRIGGPLRINAEHRQMFSPRGPVLRGRRMNGYANPQRIAIHTRMVSR